MRKIVHSGRLGKIVSCRAQLSCWFPEISGSWRQQKSTSGGGALMDMGIHCIDLLQYITGAKTKRAIGFLANQTFSYEVEDGSAVLLEFDNGAFGYVDSHFNIPDAAVRCRLEIYGTKGSILAENTIGQTEGGKLEIIIPDEIRGYDSRQNRTDVKSEELNLEFGNLYTKEIESISHSILEGTAVESPGEDALQVQCVIESIYKENRNCV
jgi:predicted dehydrogenase